MGGQYSYIDQAGKTITVRYSAGKDGFKILEGDHVPTGANGQNSAPYVATQAPRQVAAAPQPQQFTQAAVQPVSSDYDYYEDINPTQNTFVLTQTQNFVPQPQQNFAPANSNPFINPHDPTHRDFRFNVNGASFGGNTRAPRVLYLHALTALGSTPSSTPSTTPTVTPRPSSQPPQQFTPTQAPRNFFPPGKLALNRFEN